MIEIEKLNVNTTDDYIDFVKENKDLVSDVTVVETAFPMVHTKIKVTFTFLKRVQKWTVKEEEHVPTYIDHEP